MSLPLPQNQSTSNRQGTHGRSSQALSEQNTAIPSESAGKREHNALRALECLQPIASEARAGYPNCGILHSNPASLNLNSRAHSDHRTVDSGQPVNTTPLLLIADHRGEGLEDHLETLALDGFRCVVSTNHRGTLAAIDREIPALIIIDPLSRKGVEELRSLDEARTGNPPIPLLVLTYAERRADLIESLAALHNGLWDLTERRAPREEVAMRVGRLLNEASLHSEMRDLRHRASHDDRTDLLRVNAFQARLAEHFSAAQRHHFEMALVLIDLDNFGAINKRHDHTVGDILISQAGEIIRRTLRTEDIAGRIGGDEFAVVLPYTHKVDTARVVNRLVEEIHKLSGRPKGAQEDIVVAASLGFETFNGRDIATLEEMRTHAERALRAAKVAGGNRGIYFRQLDSVEEESGQA
jgi:diguanylate cyclase (GGDEF)-like protein